MYTLLTVDSDGKHGKYELGNCNDLKSTVAEESLELELAFHPEIPEREGQSWVYTAGLGLKRER